MKTKPAQAELALAFQRACTKLSSQCNTCDLYNYGRCEILRDIDGIYEAGTTCRDALMEKILQDVKKAVALSQSRESEPKG